MPASRRVDQRNLTATERRELEADVQIHGVAGAARLHGLRRGAFSSLLTGNQRDGTLALFRERRRASRDEASRAG